MKKILSTLLFAILFVSILTGCKQENTASLIAKDLDNNLNRLSVAVNKLDAIDNNYLYNPDIYSASNLNQNKKISLAFNDIETTQISNETVKQVLIDKITDKLLSQNTDCSNKDFYTCEKYCDNNGNCYYRDCNGNNYCYDTNGECSTCDSIPDTCQYMGQRNISCNTSTEDNDTFHVELISNIDNDDLIDNTEYELDENNEDLTTNSDSIENNSSDSTQVIETPNPRVKLFYFSQDSFSPVKLKYNPRYISQYDETAINDQIENYLFKVQKLYAMTEDSIEANNILQSCKENIIECIREIRDLNSCIINGQCEPSIQELQALNNYIVDIKTTTKRLKNCNGELNDEIDKISETNSTVIINSVDVMNSNYLRLLNHIDTRITYHKSAIATLEQIKYLLDNAINDNGISDEEIEQIIESFTTQEIIDDDTSIEDNQEAIENKENTSISNEESSIDNNDNSELLDDANQDDETINTNFDDNETLYDTNSTDTNYVDTATEDVIIEEADTNTTEDVTNDSNSFLDTYKETNSWSNIDTYKSSEKNPDESATTITTDSIDNAVIQEENLSNDSNNEDTLDLTNNTNNVNTNTAINNDSTSDNVVNENADNNANLNNNMVDTTINDEIYNNSVITQNNLNNDNGYGGYYYTSDGEIKNNGVNNNNEIGNNGNTIENTTNRENNVNTYGYNTLLDIINQGTVNNGINTL